MNLSLQVRRSLARAAVVAIAAAGIWVIRGVENDHATLLGAMIALMVVFVVGLVIPPHKMSAAFQMGLLSIDLTALAVIGCVLVEGSMLTGDARIPFLCAYLVATLVAVVGHRFTAGPLGALGGAMILAVGTALMVEPNTTLHPVLLGVQFALIVTTAVHTNSIAGGLKRERRRRELKEAIDNELKLRESSAAELVSFTQALADSNSISEIADALLRHLRCHTEVSVRAIVLESESEDVAIWEEAGSGDPQETERRRIRLQESLTNVGSNHMLQHVQCHSTGLGRDPRKAGQYRTAVDLPVQVGGRVAGVLFLADPRPAALTPDRIGVLVDITRRTSAAIRRFERNRDRENRRTAILLRQMREGVLLLGSDGQVLLANPAAREALLGCSEEDIDPEKTAEIGDISLAELAQTPPGVSRRFRATIPGSQGEHSTQLACTAISVVDHGRRIGTLVTLSDVTEEELTRGRIIQAEKMTLVGQTLAGVAHELNNPLAALIGYSDLLRMRELSEEVERPIAQMREQALRATRIVRNLLNFARRRNPERVPTAVAELITGTVELFAYEARMGGVEVEVDIAEDLPPVLADKHALQQVLVNLVQNALHALEKWNGSRTLTIRATKDTNGLLVSVTDSGPGVPADLRARIFDSFFTTKGQTKGTGLGLALSRTIAQEHGGDLLLAPGSNGGACFTLRLPRHTPGRMAVRTPAQQAAGQAAWRVPDALLVVDDEASVRETLVAQLGSLGASVDSAANAIEAERMIGEKRYGALVVDIRMPGASGLDLHDSIAERDPFLADRIIFMTGDFVNGDLIQKAKATGRQLLEKPFTLPELTAAIGQAVSGGMGGDEPTGEFDEFAAFLKRRSA